MRVLEDLVLNDQKSEALQASYTEREKIEQRRQPFGDCQLPKLENRNENRIPKKRKMNQQLMKR